MKKISKALSIILLLTFSLIINQCASNQKTDTKPVSFTEEVPKTINEIYFKDGKVIQCDIVWEGVESEILCKKSEDILAYSADDVDLVKTFGETDAKEIAKRYEEIKGREESAKILRSIGPHQYVGGASSFSTDEIAVSGFGVTTRRSGPYQHWVASCVVRNLTSAPRYVSVYIQGVTSDGFILRRESISGGGRIWGGEYKKCSSEISFRSDDNRITKWEIYEIWSKAARRYK